MVASQISTGSSMIWKFLGTNSLWLKEFDELPNAINRKRLLKHVLYTQSRNVVVQ